jgi:hypothetical protein
LCEQSVIAVIFRQSKDSTARENRIKRRYMSIEDQKRLAAMLNNEYQINADLGGNGCIHGFKPARDCPNEDCDTRRLDSLWHNFWTELFGELK